MQEKRQYVRLPATVRVEYRLVSHAASPVATNTQDISLSGIRMRLPEPFKKGDVIQVKFFLPAHSDPLEVLGEVVWARTVDRKSAQEPGWEVGVRFTSIGNNERALLNQYLESNYRPPSSKT